MLKYLSYHRFVFLHIQIKRNIISTEHSVQQSSALRNEGKRRRCRSCKPSLDIDIVDESGR
jgi:hypothetical protein